MPNYHIIHNEDFREGKWALWVDDQKIITGDAIPDLAKYVEKMLAG